MPSSPKEQTSKVEPWDGAKPYLLDQYKLLDDAFKNGAPKPWEGKQVADQSKATLDALQGTENLARNGNTATLTNATNAVNSVMNQGNNTQANQTLSQLQQQMNFGTNPTDAIAKNIANGSNIGQNYTNAAAGTAAGLQGYSNGAISQFQGMTGYQNPALAQAQGYGGYTNAAAGLQSNQANSLAQSNNPAMQYLQQTASGANVGNNPFLDKMVSNQQDAIANKLKNITNPGIDSQAASLGRMGSAAYATQRNNAESTAANEMAKVATEAYQAQYNQDTANQLNAAGQYGNLANQDVANRLNANQALAGTDAQQQQLRQAGTSLYGDLANSQQSQRLNAANSLSSAYDSQQAARLGANANYAGIMDSQNAARQAALNSNRDFQMQGANLASNNYQNSIANLFAGNNQRLNAANAANNQQNAVADQRLNAANMAGQTYANQYLPYQQLAGVGDARDARSDLQLRAEIDKWDRMQQQPIQNAANFINLLNSGGYNNTKTQVYSNTGGQMLGGLAALAGLFV
ncbi:hypothetical protein [Sinorhizobium meliloti]|uniref:hypothetical protein n=1 Tax=Rhizobium meliloti TaxID=382 RepID=UPI000FD81A4C|nr:hypothetical protein [Sinorhizobium meliloti]RVM26255.1 hypothetical protein CN132_16475 [Sinorhizobium meliloti]